MYVNLCAKCGVNYAMLQCHCFRAKGTPVWIIDTANYRSGVLHFEIEETQRNSDYKEKKLLLRIRAMIENQIAFSPRRVYCLYEIIDYYYYYYYYYYYCYCYYYCYYYYYYYYEEGIVSETLFCQKRRPFTGAEPRITYMYVSCVKDQQKTRR